MIQQKIHVHNINFKKGLKLLKNRNERKNGDESRNRGEYSFLVIFFGPTEEIREIVHLKIGFWFFCCKTNKLISEELLVSARLSFTFWIREVLWLYFASFYSHHKPHSYVTLLVLHTDTDIVCIRDRRRFYGLIVNSISQNSIENKFCAKFYSPREGIKTKIKKYFFFSNHQAFSTIILSQKILQITRRIHLYGIFSSFKF